MQNSPLASYRVSQQTQPFSPPTHAPLRTRSDARRRAPGPAGPRPPAALESSEPRAAEPEPSACCQSTPQQSMWPREDRFNLLNDAGPHLTTANASDKATKQNIPSPVKHTKKKKT